MSEIKTGDSIEHKLLPGFVMEVLEVEPCDPPDHPSYRIVDPEGHSDWLCSKDVRLVKGHHGPQHQAQS